MKGYQTDIHKHREEKYLKADVAGVPALLWRQFSKIILEIEISF